MSGTEMNQTRPEHTFWLPHPLVLAAAIPIALIVGLASANSNGPVFPIAFVAGAALGPLAAISLALRRLQFPATRSRVLVAFALGVVPTIPLAIALEMILPAIILGLVLPLRDVFADALDYGSLEEFFYSPVLVIALVHMAVVAPLAEELVKPLGVLIMARRLRSRSEAFIAGMAGGVVFAVIENMFYGSIGLFGYGGYWAGVVAVRSIGAVLHPLTAGMVGVAWYDLVQRRPAAGRRLLGIFSLAVLIHALWNGGITLLMSAGGTYYFETRQWEITIYDVGLPLSIFVLLALLSLFMWLALWAVTGRLAQVSEETPAMVWRLRSSRQLAALGLGMLLIVPLGALGTPYIVDYLPVLRSS